MHAGQRVSLPIIATMHTLPPPIFNSVIIGDKQKNYAKLNGLVVQ